MRTLLFLLIASFQIMNSSLSYCQEESRFKNSSIKFLMNGSYKYESGLSPYDRYAYGGSYFENKQFDIGHLSIAIEINQDKSFRHEFELMPIRLNNSYDLSYGMSADSIIQIYFGGGGKSRRVESAFCYQFKYSFETDKSLVPQIGLSSQLYYTFHKEIPMFSYLYPTLEQRSGLMFSIIPGLIINITDRVAIDMNLPFHFYDLGIRYSYYKNPNLTENERKSNVLYGDFIPNYISGRVGISYRL